MTQWWKKDNVRYTGDTKAIQNRSDNEVIMMKSIDNNHDDMYLINASLGISSINLFRKLL